MPRTHFHRFTLSALLGAALLLPAGAAHAAVGDANLDQQIDADQPIADEARALSAGHVDLGPRYVDGHWSFLIHDDAAKADADAASVWRSPERTVLHVLDAAELTVPDDPAYAFLPAAPGESVHVVPQTQHPDVVWIGWNTQDPEVMTTIDRGVTLSLDAVQGPGDVTVYLQSGSFGEPDVLWDSREEESQPIWVDVNTHTHANWVFTKPGVYLLQLTAAADLIDGGTVSDTQQLRVAVGTDTDPAGALAATWTGAEQTELDQDVTGSDAAAAEPTESAQADGVVTVLVVAIAVVAVVVIALFVIAAARGSRARQRVLQQRSGAGA